MVQYSCRRCGLDTKIRTHFKRHIYRKHACKPIIEDIDIKIIQEEFENLKNEKKGQKKDIFGHLVDKKCPLKIYAKCFTCDFCNNAYKTEQTKKRHMKKYCRAKKSVIQMEKMKKLAKENEELKEQLNKSSINLNTSIINNIHTINNDNSVHNINNINNINNITINNYGSENLSYITEQYIHKLLNTNPIQAIRILIKNIHYHPEHPENHNIRITATNKRQNVASVWKDNKWVLRDRRTVIEDMVSKGFNILDDEYIKSVEDGNDSENPQFNEFQNQYEKPDKSVHKNLKKEAELVILNGTSDTNKVTKLNKIN